jgi:hypothetical protein
VETADPNSELERVTSVAEAGGKPSEIQRNRQSVLKLIGRSIIYGFVVVSGVIVGFVIAIILGSHFGWLKFSC